jgi:copper chaperone CopZ
MKKNLKIEVDCANCARKVEEAVAKVDGVNSVRVNFITQRITLDLADGDQDRIMKDIRAAAKRVEPDCVIG